MGLVGQKDIPRHALGGQVEDQPVVDGAAATARVPKARMRGWKTGHGVPRWNGELVPAKLLRLPFMTGYVELRTRSFYSFGEGASHIHELLKRACDLRYPALALTDTNLCGALEFAKLARQWGIKPITGGQMVLLDGSRVTLLARDRKGHANLSRLFTEANGVDRRAPLLDPMRLADHGEGLVLITGCADSPLSRLLVEGKETEAGALLEQYQESVGRDAVFVGLQQNRVFGDTTRNKRLVEMARRMGVPLVATNDALYHLPTRYKLQTILTAIKHNQTLGEAIDFIKPNEEFYLKPAAEMEEIFRECPEAVRNTLTVAEMCGFDLSTDLGYQLPEARVPKGYTNESYLLQLCHDAARRRFNGTLPDAVHKRLQEEFTLFRRHNLAGFLLLYREIVEIAQKIMVDEGLTPPETPIEVRPPGRSRGSSVALLTGYLIGISHVNPLLYDLTLERFMPEEALLTVPDIDLDFPRHLRDKLITRVHQEFGPDKAVMVGAISTYRIRGIIADVGKALGLPPEGLRRLADSVHSHDLRGEMLALADFAEKVDAPGWRDLIEVAPQLLQAPKGLGQHVGGLVLSSSPIPEMVPVRLGAIEGRYIMDWNKDSVDDARFAKIDLLSLPVLDQIGDTLELVERRTGDRIDLNAVTVDQDPVVYDMINEGNGIGVFMLQSPAQLKVARRIKSRTLKDIAYQVALIRPGVGVQGSAVSNFINRYRHDAPWKCEHPLQERALNRGYGIIIWQEQVVQLIADMSGMSTAKADEIRRAFARPNNAHLLAMYRKEFMAGTAAKDIPEAVAERAWSKINGHYMFPESHSYAFGISALQAAWLKAHYPLEFYTALMNNQPMGFYPLEVIKQDARRRKVGFLNPDVNASAVDCGPSADQILMGLRFVKDLQSTLAAKVVEERKTNGPFGSVGDFVQRLALRPHAMRSLVLAGGFDSIRPNRREALWEAGLYDGPQGHQMPLPFSLDHEVPDFPDFTPYEKAVSEYSTMGVYPRGHLMEFLREQIGDVRTTLEVEAAAEGEEVTTAGWVIARQHPRGEDWTSFLTIEDEYFHTQLIFWPQVYHRYRDVLQNPVIKVRGQISRWDGTANLIVSTVKAIEIPLVLPKSHDWH